MILLFGRLKNIKSSISKSHIWLKIGRGTPKNRGGYPPKNAIFSEKVGTSKNGYFLGQNSPLVLAEILTPTPKKDHIFGKIWETP